MSPWNIFSFLSCTLSSGNSSFSSPRASFFLSLLPPSPLSHQPAQHYSSMGAVAVQIKCCNPEAQGCSACMFLCVHMHDCLQRSGCFWLPYNMATAVVYDRCFIPHPLSIIISIIIIPPSFEFRRGGGTAEPMVRSWDDFSAHSGKQQLDERGGEGERED